MSDSTNATPRSAVKVLQLIAFLALTALLLGTFGNWLRSASGTRLSWGLTPAAFSIALLVLSLLMAWTSRGDRRPGC